MPTASPNLNLTLYDSSATDVATKFRQFRTVVTGSGSDSNMSKIDVAFGNLQAAVALLQTAGASVLYANCIRSSATAYTATVGSYSSYVNNMFMVISLDYSNTGALTLNINSIGPIYIKRHNNVGDIVDIDAGILVAGKEYLIRYNGTYFMLVSTLLPEDIGALGVKGDAKDNVVSFTEAASYAAPQTGDKISVLFGKILKRFNLLGGLANKSSIGSSDIDVNGVANTNLAQMAAKTVKGNLATAAANASDVTVPALRTAMNVADGADVTNTVLNAAAAETGIVDADIAPFMKSSDSNILRKITWANIKVVLKAYFDTIYTMAALKIAGYSKPSNTGALAATDTVNAALGKLEKGLDGKAASSHSHTKSEITDFPTSMTPTSHASTHAAGGADAITPADIGAAVPIAYSTASSDAITLVDNTIITRTEATAVTITYPTGNYICTVVLTFAASGTFSVTFPAGTTYLGSVPTWAASVTYEISVRNGVAAIGEVGTGA